MNLPLFYELKIILFIYLFAVNQLIYKSAHLKYEFASNDY